MKKGPFFDTIKSIRIRECIDGIKSGQFTNGKKQTLNDIGLEIGYAPETISRIKNGHQEASLEFVQLLIDHYCNNICLDYLVGKNDYKNEAESEECARKSGFLLSQAEELILKSNGISRLFSKYFTDEEIDSIKNELNNNSPIAEKEALLRIDKSTSFPKEISLSWNGEIIYVPILDYLQTFLNAETAYVDEYKKLFLKNGYELLPKKKTE